MNNEKKNYEKLNIIVIRVVSEFYPMKGGSITHVIELINAINPYLYKQILIAPMYNNMDVNFDKNFCIPIIRLRSRFFQSNKFHYKPILPYIKLLSYSFKSILEIRKIIKNENNKNNKIIIHAHNLLLGEFLMIFSKFFLLHAPIVIMQHGSPIYSVKHTIKSKIFRKNMCLLLKFFKPDYYLNFDDGTINPRFVNFLNKQKIKNIIVNHAIDTELFKPHGMRKENDEFIIFSHHRLDTFKRIDLSIKIFKCFLDKVGCNYNVKFKIVGKGQECQELKKLATSLGLNNQITFCGEKNIEEIIKEIESADIIIGTSLISNINRSILEAMSCGKPVVIFKSGKIDEFFVNMENIILVSPNNIGEFADNIKLLWENRELREKIGRNARNVIVSKRTWDQRIQQEFAVYNELIKN